MKRFGLSAMALVAVVALSLGGCGDKKAEPAKAAGAAATAAADGKYKCGKCNGTKDLKKGDAVPSCCGEPMKTA
ncbi:MAG: hypothetical protein L0216_05970 [Planctomycetales bacterium]|nr:hypothetical protein [Planctomycetales bacterium]